MSERATCLVPLAAHCSLQTRRRRRRRLGRLPMAHGFAPSMQWLRQSNKWPQLYCYLVCGVYILYNVSERSRSPQPLSRMAGDARAAGHGQTRETLC